MKTTLLKLFLITNNISYRDFCKLLEMDCDKNISYISRLVNGKVNVSFKQQSRIASALNSTPEKLFEVVSIEHPYNYFCKTCKKKFKAKQINREFCNWNCFVAFSQNKLNLFENKCAVCNKITYKSRTGYKFHSIECKRIYNNSSVLEKAEYDKSYSLYVKNRKALMKGQANDI